MNTTLPCLGIRGVQLMGQPASAKILPFTAMTGEKVGVAPEVTLGITQGSKKACTGSRSTLVPQVQNRSISGPDKQTIKK